MITLRDYANAALDASSFVEAAQSTEVEHGVVCVFVRGLGGVTPQFLIERVQEHLDDEAPVGTAVCAAHWDGLVWSKSEGRLVYRKGFVHRPGTIPGIGDYHRPPEAYSRSRGPRFENERTPVES